MMSSDRFLSNIVSRDQHHSQRILDISLPHRSLPQNDRICMGRGYQENGGRVLSNVICRGGTGLEAYTNDIDELVEEHSQELTIEELMKLQCILQGEVMEESLTDEEEVTAKQQSSAQ
ncbi:hypothetical protein AVEN_269450-1 [Araneus ventricosus]|uniref:Uncharacterized protein n=1 Tax=Araneus ventricosus TaxID=182803 RepID=A0A4Y2M697_ARAVE|nr:hypothetical protein AVEN_269450-1 [Araneus ventricosus]